MILLLDAHVLVWWLTDDTRLSRNARAAISDPSNVVLVSAASVWELGVKQAAGKLELPPELPDAIDQAGFVGVPVTLQDGLAAAMLAAHHRDPFDRMLVAQANRLDAVIVSRDKAFASYDVRVIPA